jgi:hypothetical protein
MNLIEAFIGCCTWIPVGIWIVSLMNWMVLGEVDVVSGLAGITVALMLGFLAFKPPIPGMTPFLFVALALSVVIYPIARAGMNKKALNSIDVDGVDQAYQLLGQRPNNPMALFKIAKHLYALGFYGHAIAIADQAMKHLPPKTFLDEHRTFRLWKATPPRASSYRPLPCVECGHLNEPGRVHCERCGEPYLLHVVQGKFIPGKSGRKLVAIWISFVVLLAIVPAATALPLPGAIALIATVVAGAVAILVIAFRKAEGTHA